MDVIQGRHWRLTGLVVAMLLLAACGNTDADATPTPERDGARETATTTVTTAAGEPTPIALDACPLDAAACDFARAVDAAFTGSDPAALGGLAHGEEYTCPESRDDTQDPLVQLCYQSAPGDVIVAVPFDAGGRDALAPVSRLGEFHDYWRDQPELVAIGCPEDDPACTGAIALTFWIDAPEISTEGSWYRTPPVAVVFAGERDDAGFGISWLAAHGTPRDIFLEGGTPQVYEYAPEFIDNESLFFPVGEPAGDIPAFSLESCGATHPAFDAMTCDIILKTHQAVTSGDTETFLRLLPPWTITCEGEAFQYEAICDGAASGTDFQVYVGNGLNGTDRVTVEEVAEHLRAIAPTARLVSVGCELPGGAPLDSMNCHDVLALAYASDRPGGAGSDPIVTTVIVEREAREPYGINTASFLVDRFPRETVVHGGMLSGEGLPEALARFHTFTPLKGANPVDPARDPAPVEVAPITTTDCPISQSACDVARAIDEALQAGDLDALIGMAQMSKVGVVDCSLPEHPDKDQPPCPEGVDSHGMTEMFNIEDPAFRTQHPTDIDLDDLAVYLEPLLRQSRVIAVGCNEDPHFDDEQCARGATVVVSRPDGAVTLFGAGWFGDAPTYGGVTTVSEPPVAMLEGGVRPPLADAGHYGYSAVFYPYEASAPTGSE